MQQLIIQTICAKRTQLFPATIESLFLSHVHVFMQKMGGGGGGGGGGGYR